MSDSSSRVGTEFGHYVLKRLIGRGGMGEVYEAEDTRRDRTVALKLLPSAVSHDAVFRKRLQREAHSAGRLQEPHVVPIHDYGEIDGVLFVDMRLIDGTDLRAILTRFGPMTPARSVAIVRQIAAALDAAHEGGIMHRDVKPENILITRDDFAYLVDFGIANAATDEKLTELGTAVGTYAYMAPERFSNDEVTYRADIYALACVLHECLTGGKPFNANSVSSLITAHLMQPVPTPSAVRPGIPPEFDSVIARGMAKDPNDRFASAGDLALAAHAALESRDQDKAETILARSGSAQPAEYGVAMTPPMQAPPVQTPTPTPAATPAPFVAASSQPPYQPPPYVPPGGQPPGGYPPPGQPPGGQPPGGPPWQQPPNAFGPPPGGQPPKRNWVPIIAAIVAFLLVVGGAVTAVVLLTGGDDKKPTASGTTSTTAASSTKPTSTRSSPSRTSPTESTSSSTGAQARLMGLLPEGYPSGACKPDNPVDRALATVDCGANSKPGGPTHSQYLLFADQATLDDFFKQAYGEDTLQPCPGSNSQSPINWNYTATPDVVAGQVSCGTYKDKPDIVWTRNGDLILGIAQGTDITSLHDWWLKFG